MSWKSVTTFLTEEAGDQALLEAAIALADQQEAHLDVFAMGIALTQAEAFYGGTPVFGLPGAFDDASRQSAEIEALARKRLTGVPNAKVTALSILSLGMQSTIAEVARFADVIVASLPYAPGRSSYDVEIIEACLFAAHAPVLVVPRELPPQFTKVIVAWNGSPEALRAVRDSVPLLRKASAVEIVVIDAGSRGNDEPAPGLRLKEMLVRHGCAVDVTVLDSGGMSVSQVLQNRAKTSGADLMVLGAYSHSRLRQAILGGATRSLLSQSEIPVLLGR